MRGDRLMFQLQKTKEKNTNFPLTDKGLRVGLDRSGLKWSPEDYFTFLRTSKASLPPRRPAA
jgi:hypothetical protein